MRRVVKAALVLALAATLAGLAGGFGLAVHGARYFFLERSRLRLEPVSPAAFAAANAALAPAPGRRLVVFGDSRAAQFALPQAGAGRQVVNRGLAGESTVQMAYRFEADVLSLSPDVVVIVAGINDLVAAANLPEMERAAMAAAAANIARFARAAAAAGSEVVISTVVRPAAPRLIRRPFWSDRVYELVAELNGQIRALAGPHIRVLEADALLADDAARLPPAFATDEIHLSTTANAVLDGALARLLPPPRSP